MKAVTISKNGGPEVLEIKDITRGEDIPVYQVKKEYPALAIIINGGIKSVAEIQQHWQNLDGVMMGREAYHRPFFLADIEHELFQQPLIDRKEVLDKLIQYVDNQLALGVPLQRMTRPILGLYAGEAGGKHWRRYLSENARKKNEILRFYA